MNADIWDYTIAPIHRIYRDAAKQLAKVKIPGRLMANPKPPLPVPMKNLLEKLDQMRI